MAITVVSRIYYYPAHRQATQQNQQLYIGGHSCWSDRHGTTDSVQYFIQAVAGFILCLEPDERIGVGNLRNADMLLHSVG